MQPNAAHATNRRHFESPRPQRNPPFPAGSREPSAGLEPATPSLPSVRELLPPVAGCVKCPASRSFRRLPSRAAATWCCGRALPQCFHDVPQAAPAVARGRLSSKWPRESRASRSSSCGAAGRAPPPRPRRLGDARRRPAVVHGQPVVAGAVRISRGVLGCQSSASGAGGVLNPLMSG